MIQIPQEQLTEDTKTFVKEALRKGKVKIQFTKVDGTLRDMICTLNMENLISEEFHPKPLAEGAKPRAQSPEVQTVFDLEKQAWRSFRWDSLCGITLSDELDLLII